MENIVSHHENAIAKLSARGLDESYLPNLVEQTEWASLISNMGFSYEEELAMKKLGRNNEAKLNSKNFSLDIPDSASSQNSNEFSISEIATRNSSIKKNSNSSFQNHMDIKKPFPASSCKLALAANKLPLFKKEKSTNSSETVTIDRIMWSRSLSSKTGHSFSALDYTKNRNAVEAKGSSNSRYHLELTAGFILEKIELNLKGNKANIFLMYYFI
jgi:predicted protein tyrosine phosphatase